MPEQHLVSFFALTRITYLVLAFLFVLALARLKSPWVGLVGVALLFFIGWLASNYPLERLYGLFLPGDRLRNLSWTMTAAAGNSLLSTGIIGQQINFDPAWASLVAALSFGSPDRVLSLYPYLSAGVMLSLMLSLFYHFKPRTSSYPATEAGDWSYLRPVSVVFFVSLLATAPLDYLGPYRGYWTKMFLLKPNHALALVPLTFAVGQLAKTTRRSILLGGLLLGLVGWAFIVHWALICFGLFVYLLVILNKSRPKLGRVGREGLRIAAIVMLSSAVVAPWFMRLATDFPRAVSLSSASGPEIGRVAVGEHLYQGSNSLLFLATLDQGLVFYLGVIGVIAWFRSRERRDHFWASLVIGSYGVMLGNYLLYLMGRARGDELYYFLLFGLARPAHEGRFLQAWDELYYFTLFVLSVAAGNGFWQCLISARRWLPNERIVAVAFVGLIPLGFPYWWNPMIMDGHFRRTLEPIPKSVVEMTDWIRAETSGLDVFAASADPTHWFPALTGRQTLQENESVRVLRGILAGEIRPDQDGRLPHRLSYVAMDRQLARSVNIHPDDLQDRPGFELATRVGQIRLYRLVPDQLE